MWGPGLPTGLANGRSCGFGPEQIIGPGIRPEATVLAGQSQGGRERASVRTPPTATEPGRRLKTYGFLKKMTVRTLPRTPRGRGAKGKQKNVLKYSWPKCGMKSEAPLLGGS